MHTHRERDRERQKDGQRQRDRNRERETETHTQRDTQRDTQREIHTHRGRDRERERDRNRARSWLVSPKQAGDFFGEKVRIIMPQPSKYTALELNSCRSLHSYCFKNIIGIGMRL